MPNDVATNPASLLPGQRITVVSLRASGAGRVTERTFTVTRVAPASPHAPAGWMVDLEGPCGGWAALVTVAATGRVRLLAGREERSVVRLDVLAGQVAA